MFYKLYFMKILPWLWNLKRKTKKNLSRVTLSNISPRNSEINTSICTFLAISYVLRFYKTFAREGLIWYYWLCINCGISFNINDNSRGEKLGGEFCGSLCWLSQEIIDAISESTTCESVDWLILPLLPVNPSMAAEISRTKSTITPSTPIKFCM